MNKVYTPYIHISEDDILILGEKEGLIALGEALK